MIRLSIEKSRQIIVAASPTCVEMLRFFQGRGGWIAVPPQVAAVRSRLRIDDYVTLYEDYRRIGICVMLAFVEPEELREWDRELCALSIEEQQLQLEEFANDCDSFGESLGGFFDLPETEEALSAARKQFELLPNDAQVRLTRMAQFLWSAMLAGFHNIISVMVHGEALTSLVPKAIHGDDEAYCKAVQIDRQLFLRHPYFISRFEQATADGDEAFLAKVAYRLKTPTARGKIRYPGLWTVFAMLDTLGWLDSSLTAEEILDICDEAGLHRFENRIEDPLALSKRIRAYRQMQKTALLSRH